jgi:hypothetical protein
MTRFDDLDRALSAWLDSEALAPAPPSVLASVTAVTARRRPRPAWLARIRQVTVPWPSVSIGPVPVIAILWLLLVVSALTVVGAAILLDQRPEDRLGVVPSLPVHSPPLPTSTPAPVPGPVPSGLRHAWIGEPRILPDYGTETRTKLNFDATSFWGTGTNYPPRVADSSVAFEGDTLVLTGLGGDCGSDQAGRYSWGLSDGGTILTVRLDVDPCEMRATLAPGTWFRTDCRNVADQCLGLLEAGTYKSQYVDPRVNNGAWIPMFGAITFTVPAGWANSGDYPSEFILTPATDYANESPDGPAPGAIHEIRVFTQPAAAIQDGSCEANDDPTIGLTVNDLVAWLRAQPSIESSSPTPITIDGHTGQMLDIRLSPSWATSCPGDTDPSAALLTESGFHLDSYVFGLVRGEEARLILLDLGQDDVVGIAVDSSLADRFGELVDRGMPIVESFRFR